jgi:hypothetical protein
MKACVWFIPILVLLPANPTFAHAFEVVLGIRTSKTLEVKASTYDGTPVMNLVLELSLEDNANTVARLPLNEGNGGVYTAQMPDVMAKQYTVRIEDRTPGFTTVQAVGTAGWPLEKPLALVLPASPTKVKFDDLFRMIVGPLLLSGGVLVLMMIIQRFRHKPIKDERKVNP